MRVEPEIQTRDDVVACKTCGLLSRIDAMPAGQSAFCSRCGTQIVAHRKHSLARTAAFSLAALILYLPANTYPIMHMTYMGRASDNTIWSGCRQLFHEGSYGVAAIVFLASIVIPLVKLLGLLLLVATTGSRRWQYKRTVLYRIIDAIGRWSMLDVFLLSIMVGLVKLGDIATVLPGPGINAFAAVVILTLLASASFDPRLIWSGADDRNR